MVKDKMLKLQEKSVKNKWEVLMLSLLCRTLSVRVDASATRFLYFPQVYSEPFVIDDPTASRVTARIIALLMHSIRLRTTRSGRCNQSIGNFYN